MRLSDCLLMVHCLWNETGQIDWVRDAVLTAVGESVRGYVLNLSGIEADLQALKKELDSAGALRERADAGLQLVDAYYYQVERVRLAGRLLLFASDYQQLDDTGKQFYLHKDKYKTDCYVLKKYDPSMRGKVSPSKVYTLRRGRRSVFINDYEYHARLYRPARHGSTVARRPSRPLQSAGTAAQSRGSPLRRLGERRSRLLREPSVCRTKRKRSHEPDTGRADESPVPLSERIGGNETCIPERERGISV